MSLSGCTLLTSVAHALPIQACHMWSPTRIWSICPYPAVRTSDTAMEFLFQMPNFVMVSIDSNQAAPIGTIHLANCPKPVILELHDENDDNVTLRLVAQVLIELMILTTTKPLYYAMEKNVFLKKNILSKMLAGRRILTMRTFPSNAGWLSN